MARNSTNPFSLSSRLLFLESDADVLRLLLEVDAWSFSAINGTTFCLFMTRLGLKILRRKQHYSKSETSGKREAMLQTNIKIQKHSGFTDWVT